MNIHHMSISSTAVKDTFQNNKVCVGVFRGYSAVPLCSLAE